MSELSDAEAQVIETTRKLARKLMAEVHRKGVQPIDAAIAMIYASHDAAQEITGDPVAGLAWMYQALDTMGAQLTGGCDDDGKRTTH